MSDPARPDLGHRTLIAILGSVVLGCTAVLVFIADARPGTPLRQTLGIVGSVLLVAPALFSLLKRTGLSRSPPTWFVVHVMASAVGCVLVFAHAAGGDLISAPGLLLLAVAFVVVQGLLARALLAYPLASRFAAQRALYARPDPKRRDAIESIIEAKKALLGRIDPAADEAIYSVRLKDWLAHPGLSAKYHALCQREAALVGAREQAGALLMYWRPVHIAIAWLLLIGLLIHVLVATFFAGYVADGEPVYWWHIRAWGGP